MTEMQRRLGIIGVCVLAGVLLWAGSPAADDGGTGPKMVALLLVFGGLVAAVGTLMTKAD